MALGTITVPFPDSSMPGIDTQESGGRIINAYLEPLAAGAPGQLVYRRAPGLLNFGTTVRTGFRGGIEVSNLLYSAWANRLVSHGASGGAATDIGALTGTSKGFFARNNRTVISPAPAAWVTAHAYVVDDYVTQAGVQYRCLIAHTSGTFATDLGAGKWIAYPNGPDIVFCDPDGNYARWTPGSAIVLNYDTDLPAPNSVTQLDGFICFTISDGRVFATELNDFAINALSFATAESKADGLTRGVAWAGQLFLFGPSTTEVWANAGTEPFPFARAVVIPRGIAGPYCVTGFEDNFSRALIWVADDNSVVQLNGYIPEKISPPDLDGLIEQVTDKRQLEMSCFISRGHAFVMLSSTKSPASAPWSEWTWVYDLNTKRWSERNSYLDDRSRITGGVYFSAANNKWLCGDILSGNIQWITNTTHTEIDQPFRWRLESGAVENFPSGARVGRADFVFVTGVGLIVGTRQEVVTGAVSGTSGKVRLTVPTGFVHEGDAVTVAGVLGTTEANGTFSVHIVDATHLELNATTFANPYTSGGTMTILSPQEPIETDPVVEISWSDDGGQTYYAPIIRTLGRGQQNKQLVSLVACTGRSSWNGRRWRLDVSDPVHVGFMGAYQNVSPKVSDLG